MKNIVENQYIKTDKPLAMSYEALKAERDALAVENAGFKHALSVILEHVDVTDKGQAGVVAMIANDALLNSETPATSAALAAIEARGEWRGVEKFAQRMQEKMEGLDPIKLPAYAEEVDHLISQLYAFAIELREAK